MVTDFRSFLTQDFNMIPSIHLFTNVQGSLFFLNLLRNECDARTYKNGNVTILVTNMQMNVKREQNPEIGYSEILNSR